MALEEAKSADNMPRVKWRSEYIQANTIRGFGYYPRKPVADQDENDRQQRIADLEYQNSSTENLQGSVQVSLMQGSDASQQTLGYEKIKR